MRKLSILVMLVSVSVLLLFVDAQPLSAQGIDAVVHCNGDQSFFNTGITAQAKKNYKDKAERMTWFVVVKTPNTEVFFDFPPGHTPFVRYHIPGKIQGPAGPVSENLRNDVEDGSYDYTVTCKEPDGTTYQVDPIIEVPKKPLVKEEPPQTQSQPN